MSSNSNGQALDAKAFEYLNHPYGAVMFFDTDRELWRQERAARGSRICRITLEEVKNAADLDGLGYRTRNTLIVELPTDTFQRIRKQLREHDLREQALKLTFQLNDEGSLQSLEINGASVAPRTGRGSQVAPKSSPIAPAGTASGR
jgi:hypothetical protein